MLNIRSVAALVFIASMAAAGYVSAGHASETKEVTRTVTVYGLDDAPKFKEQVQAVCGDKALKLSDKARKACDTAQFPTLTKALRFRNAGVGAEFNALAAQR